MGRCEPPLRVDFHGKATMKPNNLLKTLGVFLAGCLVALAVLEVLLRVYNPLEIRFRPDRIVLPVNKRYSLQ